MYNYLLVSVTNVNGTTEEDYSGRGQVIPARTLPPTKLLEIPFDFSQIAQAQTCLAQMKGGSHPALYIALDAQARDLTPTSLRSLLAPSRTPFDPSYIWHEHSVVTDKEKGFGTTVALILNQHGDITIRDGEYLAANISLFTDMRQYLLVYVRPDGTGEGRWVEIEAVPSRLLRLAHEARRILVDGVFQAFMGSWEDRDEHPDAKPARAWTADRRGMGKDPVAAMLQIRADGFFRVQVAGTNMYSLYLPLPGWNLTGE